MKPIGVWYMADSGKYHFHQTDFHTDIYRENPVCGTGKAVEVVRLEANGFPLLPHLSMGCKKCLKYFYHVFPFVHPTKAITR